jgi:molybdopterin molybdotransferase
MISVEEALSHILDLFEPVGTEKVSISKAQGRVLAEDVIATHDQPPFASSAMDGYAVRAEDAEIGARLDVIGKSAAGSGFEGILGAGEAVRIFTGAPVPEGATKVVLQENVTHEQRQIEITDGPNDSDFIRPAGGDFKTGTRLSAPRRLGPSDIGLIAAMNVATVTVRRKPTFALLATGDELMPPGGELGPDQIASSNNYALKALIEQFGGSARLLPIARDDEDSLRTILGLCEDADVIVTLGGASVGDHDLVRKVAEESGLETSFYKVAMRPGKPLMAGRYNATPMIGLPGNPVSALVCGHVFLRPALDAMLGLEKAPLMRETAILAEDMGPNGPRSHYMRAKLDGSAKSLTVKAYERQDSSLLSVLSQADALLVRPTHDPARRAGDVVQIIRI